MDRLIRVQPINSLIRIQVVILALTVVIVLCLQGLSEATACLYGGGIVIANSLLQRWHLIGAANTAKSNAGMNLRKAYRCVAERWVLTILLFAVGFGVLKLAPVYLMASFIVTQLALLFGNLNRA